MEPLSARIPRDLYLWLAQLPVDGATTNSDKLRVLLTQLKRQHDGALDYVTAHAWARDLLHPVRDAVLRVEGETGDHSDVLTALLEHVSACLALLVSQAPTDASTAQKLEDLLVRRAFGLTESLLRQAASTAASAYDPAVVRRHVGTSLELAQPLLPLIARSDATTP